MAEQPGKKSASSAISGNKKQTLILAKNRTIITSSGGGAGAGGGINPIVKNDSTGNISKVGSTHRPPNGPIGNTHNRPNNFYSTGKPRPTTTPTVTPGQGLQVANGGHTHAQPPEIQGQQQQPGSGQIQHLSHGQVQGHHVGPGQGQGQGQAAGQSQLTIVSSSEEHETSSEVGSSGAGSRSYKNQQKGKLGLGEKGKNENKKKKAQKNGNLRKKNSGSNQKTTNKLQKAMMMNAKKRQNKKPNAGKQTGSRPVSSSELDSASGATETKSLKRGRFREQLIDPDIDAKTEMQCPRCLKEVIPAILGEPSRDTHIISLILCCLWCTPFMFMPYWFNCKSTPVKRCPKCGAYLTEPPVRLNCEKTPPDSSDE